MSDYFDAMSARQSDDGSINLVTVGTEGYGSFYFPNATTSYDDGERKYVIYSDDGMVEFMREKVVFVSNTRISRESLAEILSSDEDNASGDRT